MTVGPWTTALDAFEADLDRVAAALDGGRWPAVTWTFTPPGEALGQLDAQERERFEALDQRARDLAEEVRVAMSDIAEELLAGPRRRSAARDYARIGAVTSPSRTAGADTGA